MVAPSGRGGLGAGDIRQKENHRQQNRPDPRQPWPEQICAAWGEKR